MKRPEFVTLIAVVATDMPIIFNALCDVPMTVRAITARVVGFLTRPFGRDALLRPATT